MSNKKTRLYVIGDKDFGVVFVTLYPLRAAVVSRDAIEQYIAKSDTDLAGAFGEIAAATLGFITANDDREHPYSAEEVQSGTASLIQSGTTVSDADFCFISNLQDGWEHTARIPSPPVKTAITYLQKGYAEYEAKEFPAELDKIEKPVQDGADWDAPENAPNREGVPTRAGEPSPQRPRGPQRDRR